MLAVSLGYTEIVGLFLTYGINLKPTDINGWTALHHASASGTLHDVKALVIAGASRTLVTSEPSRLTPADIAKLRNRFQIYYFLKSYISELPVRPGRLLDHLVDRYNIKVPKISAERDLKNQRKARKYVKKQKKKKTKP